MMRNRSSVLTIVTLLAVLCIPLTGGTATPAAEPIAQIQVVLVDGAPADAPTLEQIQIKRAGGTAEPGRVGMQLFQNDEVTTGNGVEASLLFEKADPEYQVQVLMQEKSSARIESLWALVGRFLVSGWGSFDTKTQNVRLGKRATEFYLQVSEDGSVDVKVLRGEVEVEPIEEQPPAELGEPLLTEYSHAPSLMQKVTVGALEGVQIKKAELPTASSLRKLATEEVETVLRKTDKLMLASLAVTTPLNVIPTSYEITADVANDPQRIKALAESAFTTARRAATLQPNAENTSSLAAAYKDLGAGKRALKEYEKAVALKPQLQNSVKFLAGQAEAYRLAGNLKKADEKSKEAVAKSETESATPFEKQLALNARGNVAYDLAVQYVGAGEWRTAGAYFKQSKNLYSSATTEAQGEQVRWISDRNLKNASLAINSESAQAPPELSKFMGTYRGVARFQNAKLSLPATVVISGSRFSLIQCEGTVTGSILPRRQTGDILALDLILDASSAIRKTSLVATLGDKNRLELSSSPGEIFLFSFSTTTKQEPLQCLRSLAFPVKRRF